MEWISKDEKTGYPKLIDPRGYELKVDSSLGELERFYRGLEEGRLLATVCSGCGAKYYPPATRCRVCLSKDLRWVEVPRRGRLITYTEINVKPKTHSHYPDYIVGVADFNGFKVVGHLDSSFEGLRPDMEVEWRIVLREPEKYRYVVFKPIEE